MLFPTVTFAAFFMVVWSVTWLAARGPGRRQVVLVVASAVFYAYWDERLLFLLAATIVGNRVAAGAIGRWRDTRVGMACLWLGVGGHLAVLGWFKYYGFFATSLTSALDHLGLTIQPPLVQVALPLGISFFTFQGISHLIEVRRGVIEAGSLLEVAAWLGCFLTIASGPITRASELLPQLREELPTRVEANRAFGLILRGLFKKMVLASYLATAIADDVFAGPARHSALEVLVGIYAYAAQLYLDFSGYTDIAIGCGLLLGIRLPENFDRPYAARSITEFWGRWHMTLSRWLRDFLFTPLARHSHPTTVATCRNLMIVMLLAGLWHGAAWTYVAFGAVHGVALSAERVARVHRRRVGRRPSASPVSEAVHRFMTFHVVCLGWVFFRAESIGGALDVLGRLVSGPGPAPAVTALLAGVVLAVLVAQAAPASVRAALARGVARLGAAPAVAAGAVSLLVIDVFGPEGIPPFLYFGF